MKLVLGMKVGLSPGDFVLDGNPAPYPKRGGAPPNFRPTSIVFDVDQLSQKKRYTHPYRIWPMSIVAKWLDG